ncbi:NUDIX hydrolase [Streptosporangium sp. NPDC051022]|uniref:NUDIX hydrolase n=1 Tax=Streptosporangium sp. NPDC051022 TaxID=3155752 RepID=UPI00342D6426
MHITTANGTTPTSSTSPKVCDHLSVGVLIQNDAGEYLMFERATAPAGVAPVAGHVDDHGAAEDAARAEVTEEVGLTAVDLFRFPTGGWQPNRCRRAVAEGHRPGHHWHVYRAKVTGDLAPSAREARHPRWLTVDQVQALTERTVAYARGLISDAEFAAEPGLEPVWVRLLANCWMIAVDDEDLLLIDDLAARSPLTPTSAPAEPVAMETQPEITPLPGSERGRAHLDRLDERGAADLIAETGAARTELTRTDTKAGILLAFTATAFSVLTALTALAPLATAPRVGLAAAVAILAGAAGLAVSVICPSLPPPGQASGVLAHADASTPEQLLQTLADAPETRRAREVICLAQIARTKYRRLRWTAWLVLSALAVVVACLPLGWL